MSAAVRLVPGAGLPDSKGGIREVYIETFCAPPWNEEPARADAYLERLERGITRPGFTAALAHGDGGTVLGFATAWTTQPPSPPAAATRRPQPPSARTGSRSGCAAAGKSTNSPCVPARRASGWGRRC